MAKRSRRSRASKDCELLTRAEFHGSLRALAVWKTKVVDRLQTLEAVIWPQDLGDTGESYPEVRVWLVAARQELKALGERLDGFEFSVKRFEEWKAQLLGHLVHTEARRRAWWYFWRK